MRKYLQQQEIVGAVMVYQEGEIIRWCLNWLYENCDRVFIQLDNYNDETYNIVMEYKKKYPDKTRISFSNVEVDAFTNYTKGRVKQRFKALQGHIRQKALDEIKKMHEEKPIDLLIWPDSDEFFVDRFPIVLEEFWKSKATQLVLGFIEVYDNFRIILNQRMVPHGRAWKYNPEMSALPYVGRTRYKVYKRDFKRRYMVIHLCHFTPEQRAFRKRTTGIDINNPNGGRFFWVLPEDARSISLKELLPYRDGRDPQNRVKGTPLSEYLNNKEKYNTYE